MPIQQAEFAELVGISPAKVSQLVADGVIVRGQTAHAWILDYCERLREVAAGRASGEAGGLDLVQERAALARAQREGVDIKNAIARGQYAPIELLTAVLATASQSIADRFEALPGALHKVCPLPVEGRNALETALASARNDWLRSTAALAVEALEEDDDEEDGQGGVPA
ncbi:hypothetical protein [Xylophilus ampelinus]|uniref:hypothetical protein n=1 Tax=Xylophilus ampelinus TaxID=54067 RepID=UPI001F1A7578|nr:hypothetical protein [Xylophilus ampelinus]MCS4508902.1 hypothetical protein [Xylophilus ampelinus]